MKGKEKETTVTGIQSELSTRCHLEQGKKKCSIHECTNCPTAGQVSVRNRCHSELIVMGSILITIITVIIFHYNVFGSSSRVSADHISYFSPPIEFKPEGNGSSLVQFETSVFEQPKDAIMPAKNDPILPDTVKRTSTLNESISSAPSITLESQVSVNETSDKINEGSNGTQSVSWIERKLKSYDPRIFTEALILIEKLIHWINSSLTLSIITPLILGSSAGLILVLLIMYYRHILICLFHCLTCGCITCYCRKRNRRQNYELGLKGKFFDGKRYDELENHYLLVPKKEDEAVDVDEDSDTEVELYNKQKVNV